MPFVPLICSIIVLWNCWRPSKFVERWREQFGRRRFSFKNSTDLIGLGIFFLFMALISFITSALLYNNGYILFLIGYITSLVEELVFLIAGIILIVYGALIKKRKTS